MTARELATKYRLDRAPVMRRLRAAGTKVRRQGLAAGQIPLAVERYLSGETLAEVGQCFGVSAGTIGRYLKLNKVTLRPPLEKAKPSSTHD